MSGKESRQGVDPRPDLTPLGEMVGARNAINKLLSEGKQLDRDAVMGVLRAEHDTLSGNKYFYLKARTLKGVIDGLEEHEEIEAREILGAMGIQPHEEKQGFSFKGLVGRLRR